METTNIEDFKFEYGKVEVMFYSYYKNTFSYKGLITDDVGIYLHLTPFDHYKSTFNATPISIKELIETEGILADQLRYDITEE